MPPRSPEKRSELADEKRSQILAAALDVFAEKGYHAAGIADIAAKLGMGHGTFYRYFDNKLAIFGAVLDDITGDITDVVREEPAGAETLEAYRAQLDRITMRLFLVLANDPRRARVVFYEAWSVDSTMRAKVLEMFEVFGAYTEGYLTNGIAKGYLRESLDVPVVARMLNALIFEGLRACMVAARPADVGVRYARAGLDFMLNGIALPEPRG